MGFLILSLVFFLIWLGLMLLSNETRREQLIMSVVGAVVTPGVLIIVAEDYRNIVSDSASAVGIEDFIFVFSLFGIAAVVYQVLFGKHLHKMKGEKIDIPHAGAHLLTHIILVLGLWAFISLIMIHIFALSSIQALIVGGLLIGTYIIAQRQDLLLDALLSGLIMAALVFIIEQLLFIRLFPVEAGAFWQFNATTSFLIGGIPAQELLWAATVGFAIGPLYEWLRRYEFKS